MGGDESIRFSSRMRYFANSIHDKMYTAALEKLFLRGPKHAGLRLIRFYLLYLLSQRP